MYVKKKYEIAFTKHVMYIADQKRTERLLQCKHNWRSKLRANVGIYRESQISSEKSNFGLYHSNNLLVWLFQKMILKNPQAPCIWIILEKFENSQKNTIFIHEISHNFERFQRNSTGAKDLLLTSSSSHI